MERAAAVEVGGSAVFDQQLEGRRVAEDLQEGVVVDEEWARFWLGIRAGQSIAVSQVSLHLQIKLHELTARRRRLDG